MDAQASKVMKRACLENLPSLPRHVSSKRSKAHYQRQTVKDIGFSSLLGLSCSHVPIDLYAWIANHFDPSTRTLKLNNGFSFTMNAKVVEKILGIPCGGVPISRKGTLESYSYIKNIINSSGPTPSVYELCCFITPELSGSMFVTTFMLLALSSFLCPNTRQVASYRYYDSIINVISIKHLDWCSYVLEWLISYITKYQLKMDARTDDSFGGCTYLLVFGRLQVKHICCTPFLDCFSDPEFCSILPDDVQMLIRHQFSSSSCQEVTNLLNFVSEKLRLTMPQARLNEVICSLQKVLQILCSELSNTLQGAHRYVTFLSDRDSESEQTDASILRQKVPKKASKRLAMKVSNLLPDLIFDSATLRSNDNQFLWESAIHDSVLDLKSLVAGSKTSILPTSEKHVDTKFLDELLISLDSTHLEQHKPAAVQKNKDNGQRRLLLLKSSDDQSQSASERSFEYMNIMYEDQNQTKTQDPQELNDSITKDLQKDFKRCSDLLDEEARNMSPARFSATQSIANRYGKQQKSTRHTQVIFATHMEQSFFSLLTSQIVGPTESPRIFQHGKTWVDQRKLSLSMVHGGYIHFHVMDCFLKMLSCNQEMITHVEGHIYQQFFEHSLIVTLMNNSLEPRMYKANFLQIVGFNIERTGLIDNGFSVNFISRTFDVLDSASSPDDTNKVVQTVIHNFKALFAMGYPNWSYNIHNFAIRYIDVPKHHFRYDSGVFDIQFMETFNGEYVPPFSNIVALRAKFLFQLATSIHNQTKTNIVQNFLSHHA
ncbi:hypothetical protein ACP4OV_029604 [Aristida adscensionis]